MVKEETAPSRFCSMPLEGVVHMAPHAKHARERMSISDSIRLRPKVIARVGNGNQGYSYLILNILGASLILHAGSLLWVGSNLNNSVKGS